MLSRKQQYEEEKKRLIEEKFSPQRGDNFRNFKKSVIRWWINRWKGIKNRDNEC